MRKEEHGLEESPKPRLADLSTKLQNITLGSHFSSPIEVE